MLLGKTSHLCSSQGARSCIITRSGNSLRARGFWLFISSGYLIRTILMLHACTIGSMKKSIRWPDSAYVAIRETN